MSVSSCLRRRVIKNIESDSATGTVNVGVSSSITNIGTSAVGGTVNVGSGATGTTNISSPTTNLGTATGTTTIFSPAINIGINNPSTITIGLSGGGLTTINNLNAINGSTAGSNISIGGNLTASTSAVSIGNGGGGPVLIGGSATRTGIVYIGSGGTGGVNIGNGTAPLVLAGSTIALQNTTTVSTLDASAPATGISIGNNITSGDINLASGGSFTGNVYIAGGSNTRTGTANFAAAGTGAVNIGNVAAPLALRGTSITFTGTSIAIGNTLTNGDVNIASGGSFTGNVYIAGGNNDRIGTANFAAAGTGAVNIGNVAAPLALRGSTTTLSSALTLGSRPTATTQLGGTTTITDNGTTNHNGTTPITMSTIPIPSAGTWLLTGSVFTGAATTAICFSSAVNTFSLPGAMTSPANNYVSISFVVATASATNYYFISNTTTNGTVMSNVYTYLTRLG